MAVHYHPDNTVVFPDVDNLQYAMREFELFLTEAQHTHISKLSGYDVQPITVLQEYARKKGFQLYRWKPSKRGANGELKCPEPRAFLVYIDPYLIVLDVVERTGFTYSSNLIYPLIQDALQWKRRIHKELHP